ncbi:hypothetical protein Tsp_06439 [Trichinella spiralis]|uniref:hypothetical protein n=1 Tax=Trichinella spiralis TaxID=6334 RepID=UPI0001EFC4D2|nr:hypothetical protein Tsp_06439 [Trichinella spiralis]
MSRLHSGGGQSTSQLGPNNHCRSSRISGCACWAANNCSLKPWAASSGQSFAAWTAHALPPTSCSHCEQLARDSAAALPCRRPARCSTLKSSSARLSSHQATCPSGNYGPCAPGIAGHKYMAGTRAEPIPSRAFLSESRNIPTLRFGQRATCVRHNSFRFPFTLAQDRPKAVSTSTVN